MSGNISKPWLCHGPGEVVAGVRSAQSKLQEWFRSRSVWCGSERPGVARGLCCHALRQGGNSIPKQNWPRQMVPIELKRQLCLIQARKCPSLGSGLFACLEEVGEARKIALYISQARLRIGCSEARGLSSAAAPEAVSQEQQKDGPCAKFANERRASRVHPLGQSKHGRKYSAMATCAFSSPGKRSFHASAPASACPSEARCTSRLLA